MKAETEMIDLFSISCGEKNGLDFFSGIKRDSVSVCFLLSSDWTLVF